MSYTENKNRKRALVIIIILLLLTLIAAGVMCLTRKGETYPTQNTEVTGDSALATVPDTLAAALKDIVTPEPAKADTVMKAPAKKKRKNVINLKGKCEEIRTDQHLWNIVKIEFRKDKTILTKTCRPMFPNTLIYSGRGEYIADAKTGEKFYILESSIDFKETPQFTLTTTDVVTFTEVYPALPASVKTIDINNGASQFYARNLKIR